MIDRLLAAAAVIAIAPFAGCDRAEAASTAFGLSTPAEMSARTKRSQPAPPAHLARRASAMPTRQSVPLSPLPDDDMQRAASVTEVHPLTAVTGMDGKIFGLAGGDPAMNGVQTYIAFYRSAGDGWWIYEIGDFVSFNVVSQTRGRVDLEIKENTIDDDGNIGVRTRPMVITFVAAATEDQPPTLNISPPLEAQ